MWLVLCHLLVIGALEMKLKPAAFCLSICLVIMSCYLVYDYFTVESVDIDCLVEEIENMDLVNMSEGMFGPERTLTDVWSIYERKKPKSTLMLKSMLSMLLGKCER